MCGFPLIGVCVLALCIRLYIFVSCFVFFLFFLFLVVAPRLTMRTLCDLGVGGSHNPFCASFCEFFSIFVPFLGSLYLFDWFLISNSLIISLYISECA